MGHGNGRHSYEARVVLLFPEMDVAKKVLRVENELLPAVQEELNKWVQHFQTAISGLVSEEPSSSSWCC